MINKLFCWFKNDKQKYIGIMKTELELESDRRIALDKVDKEYYDRNSPHYKDNNRYSCAVKSINKLIDEEISNLTK